MISPLTAQWDISLLYRSPRVQIQHYTNQQYANSRWHSWNYTPLSSHKSWKPCTNLISMSAIGPCCRSRCVTESHISLTNDKYWFTAPLQIQLQLLCDVHSHYLASLLISANCQFQHRTGRRIKPHKDYTVTVCYKSILAAHVTLKASNHTRGRTSKR